MVTKEREVFAVLTEVIKRELVVWGHNLSVWRNKTTN